jgi:predicted phage terminase large subunit-like protein
MKKTIDYIALGIQVVADRCRESFFYFVQTFWDVIIKEEPVYNWHIPFLCEELQALAVSIVSRQDKPYDLIINIPPGTTKSTIVTIMFPAWLWTQDPTIRIITNSYSMDLSIEHAIKSRDVILSDKFKRLFPEVVLRRDKSAKSSYENISTGARYTTSTGGTITGKHAHIIINDDPLNPSQAASDADRANANEHTKTLASRKVDKKNTPTITIMQRLHEMDVTGYILSKKGEKVKHICLPAELTDNVKPASLRGRYIGGLLDPVRLSKEVLAEQLIDLGSRGYAGQFEQNPVADGGNIIKKDWFEHISPTDFGRIYTSEPIVFFGDTAYTEKTENDPSGFIATCKIGNNLYITHAKKVLMKFPDLIRFLPNYVMAHGYTDRSSLRIEPKANGLSVVDQLKETTKLNITKTPTPTDSKETRLNAASPVVECGRVFLVSGAWNEEFEDEVCGFPAKAHDEYVDLLCYAIDYHIKQLRKPVDKKRIARAVY